MASCSETFAVCQALLHGHTWRRDSPDLESWLVASIGAKHARRLLDMSAACDAADTVFVVDVDDVEEFDAKLSSCITILLSQPECTVQDADFALNLYRGPFTPEQVANIRSRRHSPIPQGAVDYAWNSVLSDIGARSREFA